MLKIRTHRHRAYMTRAAHGHLTDLLAHLTGLWNVALDHRRTAWLDREVSVSRFDQMKELTVARRRDPSGWGRWPVKAQRSVLTRLDRAYARFFAKGGFPRFKGRRGVRSFELESFPKLRTNDRWTWTAVKGVGRIRWRGEPPDGDVKLLRVVRTPRRVEVQLVVAAEVEVAADVRPPVGIDLGIAARIALSTGETFPGVRIDRGELKRRQRRLSKAKIGGRNRAKRRREFAREWQRVAERERGVLHELTADLVERVSGTFAVEDLRVENMVRNRRLARSIAEQQWGALVSMLTYKAESAGGSVERVAPHHTSRECSGCGARRDLTLAVRVYRCRVCGLVIDRDVNAARNVLQRAFGPNPGGSPPDGAEQEVEWPKSGRECRERLA